MSESRELREFVPEMFDCEISDHSQLIKLSAGHTIKLRFNFVTSDNFKIFVAQNYHDDIRRQNGLTPDTVLMEGRLQIVNNLVSVFNERLFTGLEESMAESLKRAVQIRITQAVQELNP